MRRLDHPPTALPDQFPLPPEVPGLRVAVFDFDGTICRVNSWHVLLRWLLRRGGKTSIRVGTALAARVARITNARQLKRTALSNLEGWTRGEIDSLGQDLYRRSIEPELIPEAVDELHRRQNEGYRVVIATGAFDFLVRPFCALHDVQELVAASLTFAADRCTGYDVGSPASGDDKVRCLDAMLTREQVRWDESVAYSDDLLDTPLLRRVGTGFLVGEIVAGEVELPDGVQRGPW
jgi:HAD superfamily hydrolase (TIGR01490 family)